MSQPLSCSQALLNAIPPHTDTTWTEALDRVLKDVLEQCRPGYLEVPTDAVHRKVSAEGLKTKLVRRPYKPHAIAPCSTTLSSAFQLILLASPTLCPSTRIDLRSRPSSSRLKRYNIPLIPNLRCSRSSSLGRNYKTRRTRDYRALCPIEETCRSGGRMCWEVRYVRDGEEIGRVVSDQVL